MNRELFQGCQQLSTSKLDKQVTAIFAFRLDYIIGSGELKPKTLQQTKSFRSL